MVDEDSLLGDQRLGPEEALAQLAVDDFIDPSVADAPPLRPQELDCRSPRAAELLVAVVVGPSARLNGSDWQSRRPAGCRDGRWRRGRLSRIDAGQQDLGWRRPEVPAARKIEAQRDLGRLPARAARRHSSRCRWPELCVDWPARIAADCALDVASMDDPVVALGHALGNTRESWRPNEHRVQQDLALTLPRTPREEPPGDARLREPGGEDDPPPPVEAR